MHKTIYVEGEGCDRRLLEKTKIVQYLRENHYEFTGRPSEADYILLFTCAFKQEEEDYSVARFRALQNFRGRLLVYGCLPDIAPHRVGFNDHISKLAPKDLDRIDDFFDGIEVKYADVENPHAIASSPRGAFFQKIRRNLYNRDFLANRILHFRDLFVKPKSYYYLMVCRGCLGICSYCAIRRAVGAVKSKPISAIASEFEEGLKAGYRDFVLVGDDLGSYGLDGPGTLPELMNALHEKVDEFRRSTPGASAADRSVHFHLKEVHPKHLLHYESQLCQLFGRQTVKSLLCPIQSGSPRVLSLMQREHTVEDVRRFVADILRLSPGTELSTQIIAGFPTESEEDYAATLALVRELGFRWVVIFPYDRKKGTPAAEMGGQLSASAINERVKKGLRYLRRHGIKALTSCPW